MSFTPEVFFVCKHTVPLCTINQLKPPPLFSISYFFCMTHDVITRWMQVTRIFFPPLWAGVFPPFRFILLARCIRFIRHVHLVSILWMYVTLLDKSKGGWFVLYNGGAIGSFCNDMHSSLVFLL